MSGTPGTRMPNLPREALLLELGTLTTHLHSAQEEAESHKTEIQVLHRNLIILHEREQRLEDMVMQLCSELSVPSVLAPRVKDYRVPATEAIDKYIDFMTIECRADKEIWEERHKEFQDEVDKLKSKLPSSAHAFPPLPVPRQHQAIQVDVEGESDDSTRGQWKAKAKALAAEYERLSVQTRAASAGATATDEADMATAARLQKEIQKCQEELEFEQTKVKEKIQKNVELKQKIASIVERAKERDGRRRDRIQALETLAYQHGLLIDNVGNLFPTTPRCDTTRATRTRSVPASQHMSDAPSPRRGNRSHGTPPPAGAPALPRCGERFVYKGVDVVVRYSGETKFAEGTWVGLELLYGQGKHNGTVEGVSYFRCPSEKGVFVAWPSCMNYLKCVGSEG